MTIRYLGASQVTNLPVNAGDARDAGSIPGLGRSPGKEMATHSSVLAGKSYGQRNLVGYSPWGCKVSDMTELLSMHNWAHYVFKYEWVSEVTQSCPTLCDPMDCSLPGFSIHGILQARILGWVTISFSRGSSRPRDRTWVSHIGGRRFNLWATREALI